ncbi:hypothetical protein NVSP9465_04235 [Novosphingobium sp. CECT 9465]|nr:hypothetical protein NVSP9465_04235 [Novosphingobium sp. CECT 9465]
MQARFGGRRWGVLERGVSRLPYGDPARGLREARQGRIEPGPAHKAGRPALPLYGRPTASTAGSAGSVPFILATVIPGIVIRHLLDSRVVWIAVGIGVLAVRVGLDIRFGCEPDIFTDPVSNVRLDRAVIV